LNNDFSGYGQISKINKKGEEKLKAILTWTQEGESTIYLLNGKKRETGASGAALDCLENRWQTLTALMAPPAGF